MSETKKEPEILLQWTARKMQPSVILYVILIYIVFIGLAYFVFHSATAAKTLAFTLVGIIVPLVPSILKRIEYKLTGHDLMSRTKTPDDKEEYKPVFALDKLDYIVKIKHGFKFYLSIEEKNSSGRFWKKHISDKYAGEVHVETDDVQKVFDLISELGINVKS